MYSTPWDDRPSKPFITSQRHAQEEFAAWLKENDLHRLEDAEGLVWNLKVQSQELPRHDDLHAGEWRLIFLVSCLASAGDFIRTGTLDEVKDARLISLIGSQQVQLKMRPRQFAFKTIEDTRSFMVDYVASLRKEMKASNLQSTKRRLIGQHIHRIMGFGGVRPL